MASSAVPKRPKGVIDPAAVIASSESSPIESVHPYTQEAWLLVARTVRTALVEIGSGPATIDAQPVDDPYYFLFPQAHQVPTWNPDRDGVYVEVAR
ncbi:hypothetical protein [Kitasatospora sp. NPDC097691]|uniref:hypothetical protein n=1 Tax=Kitasatospora sp. NPDC097691 TaxID=3157231 RepID=UPI00332AFAA3